jgi:hypothetical protein
MEKISYEQFKTQWLEDIQDASITSVEKGKRFALKLVSQWLDFSEDSDDIFYCDGSGDGGIDIAYLQRSDNDEDATESGDIWYLVQGKYNTSFSGTDTILVEAQKLISTLRDENDSLNSTAANVLKRISEFRTNASENDKLIYVVATCDTLSNDENNVLHDIKTIGQQSFGMVFDVDSVSIETIYNRTIDSLPKKTAVELCANLVPSGGDLLVGSVKIIDLYNFLKDYKTTTNDLDLIYEKNVRKFLGSKKKVNAGIKNTLNTAPERFGLYNNGITIVAEDFSENSDAKYRLVEPYIVNGCQTTRTIWEVLDPKLNSGGTRKGSIDDWRSRLDKGIVVVKIVRVGESGEELLTDTTRYTNSQNAVTQKDFLALEKSFQDWHKIFAEKYDIYLEIQRGGWDSQKALQRIKPLSHQFNKWTRAFDLLKIYGAGWMGNPSLSYGKNPPFAPGGSTFKRVTASDFGFSTDDLYAAYLVSELTQKIGFGRGAAKTSRNQSKYLFCFVLIELLKYCMVIATIDKTNNNVSKAVIAVFSDFDSEQAGVLKDAALAIIDDYLSSAQEDSFVNEDSFKEMNDLNAFLKNESLGQKSFSPLLVEAIKLGKKGLRKQHDSDKIEQLLQKVNW